MVGDSLKHDIEPAKHYEINYFFIYQWKKNKKIMMSTFAFQVILL